MSVELKELYTMSWFRDYIFKPYGESIRLGLIIFISFIFEAIGRASEWSDMDGAWWKGTLFGATLLIVSFIRGILPQPAGSTGGK